MSITRTRFAPSPTGFMHVGGVRTALFAWLIARQANGQFVLRIEDTDQKREVEGSASHILTSLAALGIDHDEGPDNGGPYAPYTQSERIAIYHAWAQKLIDAGRAYADPYTTEELAGLREQAKAAKKAFLYRDHRPLNPPAWDGTQPLRFQSDPKSYTWHDEVMGDLSTGPEVIDDFILIKSDGFPTYNFAHIVDDAEMKISHVIRGQEFIASMPNYLNLYEALDLPRPIFATMPHIMAESGTKKLGKRDGAKDVLDYLNDGYLPEAMLNFIASLGWNDGTEQEIFTVPELIEKFRLDRVQHSGARFDEQRLLWLNGQHIRLLSLEELTTRVEPFWSGEARQSSNEYRLTVLGLVQDRLKTLSDLPLLTDYFFKEPTPNWAMITDNKQLRKYSRQELVELLNTTYESLSRLDAYESQLIQETLNQLLEQTGQKPGVLFSIIRLALTWAPFSPALNETIATLGRNTVLDRIKKSIELSTSS